MKDFDELVKIIGKLRGKKGCPWDKKQTHASLKPYIIEESYEVLDAIDKKDFHKLKDELGDLLLQVVLHARLAEERSKFTINDVIKSISAKMIRRHPHVFGKRKAKTIDEVWFNWEKIKGGESEVKSILDSVPAALPALHRADKMQKKAARVGFDWNEVSGAWDKVNEELGEINELLIAKKKKKSRIEEEIGDLLFAVVNIARKMDINAEEALSAAINKFAGRFRFIENSAKKNRVALSDMPIDEMDKLWDKAKQK